MPQEVFTLWKENKKLNGHHIIKETNLKNIDVIHVKLKLNGG